MTPTYAYQLVYIHSAQEPAIIDRELNTHAREGWRVVYTTRNVNGSWFFLLERSLEGAAERVTGHIAGEPITRGSSTY